MSHAHGPDDLPIQRFLDLTCLRCRKRIAATFQEAEELRTLISLHVEQDQLTSTQLDWLLSHFLCNACTFELERKTIRAVFN